MYNFKEWMMNEGGWSSTKTQGVKITPAVLKVADTYVKQLFSAFESWMKKNYPDTAPLKAVRPVGSGIYYEKDIEQDPDKVYGDIDYLIEYPVFADTPDSRKAETEAVRFYNRELFHFLNETKYKGIDIKESSGADGSGVVLIAEVDKDVFIQVDFVVTHAQYLGWALDRFTPIHNIKGFVSGNLYSALADTLMISMGDRGARAKLQDGALVPFKMRKNVEDIAISLNFKTLFTDIVKFFMSLKDTNAQPQFNNSDIPGIDMQNLSLSSIAHGISSLIDVLDRNGLLDGKIITYTNASQMKKAVSDTYAGKMADLRNDKKFAKAEDPMAIAARDKIFKVSQDSENEVKAILK
jgi:hypothetical protein